MHIYIPYFVPFLTHIGILRKKQTYRTIPHHPPTVTIYAMATSLQASLNSSTRALENPSCIQYERFFILPYYTYENTLKNMTMTIYGSFVASDLSHYACAQSAQMLIKGKSAVTFAISSSCYYLLGLGLVLLCRLSLFVVCHFCS